MPSGDDDCQQLYPVTSQAPMENSGAVGISAGIPNGPPDGQ